MRASKSIITYYLYDHLGNSRVVFHTKQDKCSDDPEYVAEYVADYYPFGKILREWAPCQIERYLTTYHERDKGSGYDNRGARFYDSELGRFLSTDPMAAEFAAWSTYTYVLDNPVMLVDPDGKAPRGAGDPPTTTTQIKQTFRYDRTVTRNKTEVGTDYITKTVVSKSRGMSGDITTTVITQVAIDHQGNISEEATRYGFTTSGTGDNFEFADTTPEKIAVTDVDSDLQDVVTEVAEYKSANGESNLQAKADNINLVAKAGVSITTAAVTGGLGSKVASETAKKILSNAMVRGTIAFGITQVLNGEVFDAENFSKTHKFEVEEN